MLFRPFKIDPTSQFYSARFAACLTGFVIPEEGNDSNDAHDPGGRTHHGIIQKEYSAYRDLKNLPRKSVFMAEDIEIQEIYWTHYWNPICPKLWAGLDLCYFDQFVNEGHEAGKDLQRALGFKGADVDGVVGLITLRTLAGVNDRAGLIRSYSQYRIGFYRGLAIWKYFGLGWTRREEACEAAALKMLATSAVV